MSISLPEGLNNKQYHTLTIESKYRSYLLDTGENVIQLELWTSYLGYNPTQLHGVMLQ
jgi:hypothetical protein